MLHVLMYIGEAQKGRRLNNCVLTPLGEASMMLHLKKNTDFLC